MHKTCICSIDAQELVNAYSTVSGNLHFSVHLYDWKALIVIPFVRTLYPIFPAHLLVHPQGHLVVAFLIFILDKQSCIHWQYAILFQWILNTVYIVVSCWIYRNQLMYLDKTRSLDGTFFLRDICVFYGP